MFDNSSNHGKASKPSQPPIWPNWTKEDIDRVLSKPPVLDGPFWIRKYGIRFQNQTNNAPFYPLKLLQHLLTRDVVSQDIHAIKDVKDPNEVVEQVLGLGTSDGDTYIKIFAILQIINKLPKLQRFIEKGISDQKFILSCDGSKTPVLSYLLTRSERISFNKEQFNMHLPFFSNQTDIHDLSWTNLLPYYTINDETDRSREEKFGMYGSVSKIVIHPLCHDFDHALDDLELPSEDRFFALKQFHTNDPDTFRREVKMLRGFNRTGHPHLVTLLAAFTHKKDNYLIFPWATHDLEMYWKEVRPMPNAGDVDLIRWICHQSLMLVQAISVIHHPDEDKNVPEDQRLYGRHGDLKPDNILWYKSRGFGKLVIADMGLSKTHRHTSRTYNPRNQVIAAPKYRPPELDYDEGLLGRTFDIWTLGCVFFEFLHWLHGGYKELQDVENDMMVPSIRGSDSLEYYEWVYVEDVNYYTVRVKKAATQVRLLIIDSLVMSN